MRYSILVLLAVVVMMFGSPVQGQLCEIKLLASDGAEDDRFGVSVSIDGDTAVVGARGDDDGQIDSGSAYVYEMVDGGWKVVAKLLAPDGAQGDLFGNSVSLSGDTAVVGAMHDDSNGGTNSGSAYVFEKVDRRWKVIAKLLASDGARFDAFGWSHSISGDTAVIGAFGDDDRGFESGSAYVFEKVDGVWSQVAKLLASDGDAGDFFGYSVALSDETVVVGARYDDDREDRSGSAYIYEEVDGVWTEVAKLLASDGAKDDFFGESVSLSGDTIVVGARGVDDHGERSGSVYVFEKIDGVWTEVAKLLASDGAEFEEFGFSVALSGDTVVVGAHRSFERFIDTGSVYVFERVDDVWTEVVKLQSSDDAADDGFGVSVSISGDTFVVGAWGDDDRGDWSGSASIFALDCINSDCLHLKVDNLIAGETATFTLFDGASGAKAVTVYGTKPGHAAVENYAGYCATFGIDGVTQNKVIGGFNRRFDSNGEITFKLDVSRNLSGRRLFFQSAEHSTCPDECVSNLVELVVG